MPQACQRAVIGLSRTFNKVRFSGMAQWQSRMPDRQESEISLTPP